jgi:hypothetical protein
MVFTFEVAAATYFYTLTRSRRRALKRDRADQRVVSVFRDFGFRDSRRTTGRSIDRPVPAEHRAFRLRRFHKFAGLNSSADGLHTVEENTGRAL